MILSLVKHWEKVMANEIEKARVSAIHRQLLLIPRKPADLCNDIGLNWSMALKLHENEWLSFDPKTVKELDESQETELLFVGSLIVGGCDEDLLTYLLTGLGKPYSYRVERIYYDWGAKTWKLIPTMPDLEEIFEKWLDELIESGELDTLKTVAEKITSAISRIEGEQQNDEDASG